MIEISKNKNIDRPNSQNQSELIDKDIQQVNDNNMNINNADNIKGTKNLSERELSILNENTNKAQIELSDTDKTTNDLNEAQDKLDELEKSKKNIEEDLGKIESFKEKINEADAKLKKFEKSLKIGKFVTGWKESTLAQKILTFLKVAITVAISIAISVATATTVELWVPLLVALLSIGLLYYFAKDVINIAKEKLTSALSEACEGAINFECKKIKGASEVITETAEKIKSGLDNCKNYLSEQAADIEKLKSQIKKFEIDIEEEKKNKEKEIKNYKDQINKQKEKIAETTNNLAITISSSLKNSAQVEKKARDNLSCVEEAEKEITLTQETCDKISEKSQEIQKLSNGITNQIKDFNKKTVDKLKKFAKENKIKISSEEIDELEYKFSKQKLNKFYLDKKFSAEESEGSNETIKKLIDKIFSSNVEPTEFAKLLTEIVNDQNIMNKAIMESSTKISKLAVEIKAKHVRKVQEFCTKIADTLATVKTNEQILLKMQKTYKEELISNFKKILKENFLKEGDGQKLKALKEKFKENESFKKVWNFVFLEEEKNQDFGEGEILVIKVIINELRLSGAKIENETSTANIADILGSIEATLKRVSDINGKCEENISGIQDVDLEKIKSDANEINKSIKNLQSYGEKLEVKIISKSTRIATTSAGIIIGGTAVGALGTTVGLPVTLAVGSVGLLGTALYKVIQAIKNAKKEDLVEKQEK